MLNKLNTNTADVANLYPEDLRSGFAFVPEVTAGMHERSAGGDCHLQDMRTSSVDSKVAV